MSTYRPNVCHKRRSEDESSESDGDQPSVKKLKSTGRELNLKESLGRKCREAYAWIMDIPAKKLFKERLRANEVIVLGDDEEPDILTVMKNKKSEIDLCDDEDQENRHRVSHSTPFYTDGTMVGFGLKPNKPAQNGFHSKSLKAKDQPKKPIKLHQIADQRLTPLTNPGIDVQFMLDEPQIAVNDDELQIISEIVSGKTGVDWKKIRSGRRFMVPVLPPDSIECITVEPNDASNESNGVSKSKSSGKDLAATTSKEKSISCSKGSTAQQVVREQEKQQYKLLLDKMTKMSMSCPVIKKKPPIVVDLTNENEELLSWSRPFNKDLLEKPLEEYRFNLHKPKQDVPSTSFKADSSDEEIEIEDKPLRTFRNPIKGKLDFSNREWFNDLKMAVSQETEKYMQVVKTQEHKMKRFRERRDAEAAKEKLLYEKLKIPADVFAEKDTKDDFPELTSKMEATIASLLRLDIGNPTELITRYDDIPLLRKEFRTLNEESWLMDEILNCYLKLLMERSKLDNYPSMYCFNSFFFASLSRNPTSRSIKRWSRNEDIFSYDLVCFPLNLDMVHWALCVVDNRDKTVKFYDSMAGSRHEHVTVPIRNYLIAEMQNKKGITMPTDEYTCIGVKNLPQQQNGSDCGMFTLKYAEYITRDAPITFNQEHIPYFRRRMALELLNHELM
ncbi:hypothetical protein JTE90_026835 [Oedothorax gibbosus]|uniref:Ubiquitin-like protease family profile domain-containing protein n=1 Tax=Oedothorax gibbosus TaxID=931172 RepID=A0AAV6V552_9ARAC|nr:hypothetical protein JTE90_026835 [Oedothorax gibbosus]